VRDAKRRRRAQHRGGWLIKHRRTVTLDDVENAFFPPTEVMPTGLAPRLAPPRKG
jgi:hypothetical protein